VLVDAVIVALRARGVQHIVAPYEADHQLGLLCCERVVDVVFAVDSDLLIHGARCLMLEHNMAQDTSRISTWL
jgi:exonuclease-1